MRRLRTQSSAARAAQTSTTGRIDPDADVRQLR